MKKLTASILMTLLASATVFASEPVGVLQKTEVMEKTIYGKVQDGAIIDRIGQIDLTVNGSEKGGNLNDQVDRLYEEVVHSVAKASLEAQMDAIEWTYEGKVESGPLIDRVSTVERTINGRVGTEPLQTRIASLRNSVIGVNKQVIMQPASIPETTVFKVTIDTPLTSKTAKVGDTFTFTVAEDILSGNLLVVPEGTKGTGSVTEVKKGRSFGRSGSLDVTFHDIETIGNIFFDATQGPEAKERAKSEVAAAGASVAGIALLGPIGAVGGFFIKGKDVQYNAGQAFYVQPTTEVITTGAAVEQVHVKITSDAKKATDEHKTSTSATTGDVTAESQKAEQQAVAEATHAKEEAAEKVTEKATTAHTESTEEVKQVKQAQHETQETAKATHTETEEQLDKTVVVIKKN